MEQSINPVITVLEKLFDVFNEYFFCKELERPVITISTGKRNFMGWCTTDRRWKKGRPLSPSDLEGLDDEQKKKKMDDFISSGYYEINICPEYLTQDKYTVCEVLIHEMCHLYNNLHAIQDCSRGGLYHNKKYKKVAEEHGLAVEKTEKYGYSLTSLKSETKAYIDSINVEGFNIFRKPVHGVGTVEGGNTAGEREGKPKQSMRKLVCPKCGAIARVTKQGVRIGCLACNMEMKEK